MSKIAVVFVTCKHRRQASKIAQTIVSEKLAACVNVLDVKESVYIWKGKLYREKEALLIIKTTAKNLNNLEKRIRSLHSYSCPEIITISVSRANRDYLEWAINSCQT
jgi:periplasmic divalent cation tolerance protein